MRLSAKILIANIFFLSGCVGLGPERPPQSLPGIIQDASAQEVLCANEDGRILVPNVLGATTRQAQAIIERCHLELVVQENVGTQSYLPRGTIGAQFPRGGNVAADDRRVTVFISRGFFLPNLVGWRADDAEAWLRDLRLNVFRRSIRNSAPIGTVVSHTPSNATFFDSGTQVLLIESEGLWVDLSSFEGARYSDAQRELEALNLRVRHVGGPLDSGSRPINICETQIWFPVVAVQTPNVGRVFEGDEIRIRTLRGTSSIFNPPPGAICP